jgi:hypothetical protein
MLLAFAILPAENVDNFLWLANAFADIIKNYNLVLPTIFIINF